MAQNAVDNDFLPEVNVYYKVSQHFGLSFQAKETREDGEPVQTEIGPSVSWFFRPWPKTYPAILQRDVILSVGYRYLPSPGSPPINRLEPVLTFQLPLRHEFVIRDRNRADLDWQQGNFNWRYRNLLGVERPISGGGYHPVPYVAAEFYYDSEFAKWSTTALYGGCQFPIGKHVVVNPYYVHKNFTGSSPNQQLNQVGLILNLLF